MSAIVYFAAAIATLAIAQRITRFSRAAAIIILLLPLLFTARALFTGGVFGPVDLAYTYEPLASIASRAGAGPVVNPSISDVYSEFMPWNDSLRRSIARGQWPLWDPYGLCGSPLAGAAQSSPYHPITILGLLVPLPQSFAFAAAMMLLSAALTAFLLFREFVGSEIAALFGAAGWMCSTHLIFFAGTALVLAASVTPLVLLGARHIVRQPGGRSVAILTAGLLLVVLAGHPESALHIVTFAVAYFVFEMAAAPGENRKRAVICGFAAGAIAFLLAAVFLLPIFEVIPQSEEYVHRSLGYTQVGATSAQMIHRTGANFFPFLDGAPGVEEQQHSESVRHGWLATAYAGSMLFAPALFALTRSRSRDRWFFLGATIVGLAVGVTAPGVTQLLAHLPGFSISVNDRMVAFATLGMCALAAMGIDAWDAQLSRTFAMVGAVIFVVAIAIPTRLPADYIEVNAARAVLPVALAACAVALLSKRRASLVLLALLLIQRGGEATSLQPTLPARAFYPPFPGLEVMRAKEPFRITGVGEMLPPELSTHYGLEDVRGFAATTFHRLYETYPMWSVVRPVWSNRVDRLDSPMLSLMNTRFAIVPPAMALPASWTMRASFPAYAIAENTGVLPRAFVPKNVRVVATQRESLDALRAIADFGDQGVVEDRDTRTFAQNGPGVAEVTGRGSHLIVHARMDAPGWVFVSNSFWRGWRARSDGHNVPLHFGDHAFLAFYLPAGEHDVTLVYRPRSFVAGAWISGLTALLLLGYALMPSSVITFFMSFQTSFFAEGVRRRYAG
ncbi:MAG TPA: YfhO family protein [Thermoanaerobaculia bacterium]